MGDAGPVEKNLRAGREAGLSVLEVMIALAITSTMLMATASAFSSSLSAANAALTRTRGTVFLGTVMEDLSAQEYDNLLALDGDRILDQSSEQRSCYAVDLTVFLATVDLLQVQAQLTDLGTQRVIGRVTTLRSRR